MPCYTVCRCENDFEPLSLQPVHTHLDNVFAAAALKNCIAANEDNHKSTHTHTCVHIYQIDFCVGVEMGWARRLREPDLKQGGFWQKIQWKILQFQQVGVPEPGRDLHQTAANDHPVHWVIQFKTAVLTNWACVSQSATMPISSKSSLCVVKLLNNITKLLVW